MHCVKAPSRGRAVEVPQHFANNSRTDCDHQDYDPVVIPWRDEKHEAGFKAAVKRVYKVSRFVTAKHLFPDACLYAESRKFTLTVHACRFESSKRSTND